MEIPGTFSNTSDRKEALLPKHPRLRSVMFGVVNQRVPLDMLHLVQHAKRNLMRSVESKRTTLRIHKECDFNA